MNLLVKTIFATMILLLCISNSHAWTVEGGPLMVKSLRFGGDGLYVAFNPAPTNCNGGDQYGMHVKISSTTHANYNAITSALLTAYTANKSFSHIWVNNEGTCSPTHILSLEMLQFTNQ